MCPIKSERTIIDREGVNYVRRIVEDANCIFHEIHRENDYGLDAIIELVDGVTVKGISIAVQIKSGKSYCYKSYCVLPTDKSHIDYWLNHSLLVIAIIYCPQEKCAYWQKIAAMLGENRPSSDSESYRLRISKNEETRFDKLGFEQFFLPIFFNKPILFSFDKSAEWAKSNDPKRSNIGLKSLFHQFRNQNESWDVIFALFRDRHPTEINNYIVYLMSLIPGHPDIFWTPSNRLDDRIQANLLTRISDFSTVDVVKLLAFVDENGFQRGSIGQSIEALVGAIKDKTGILKKIVLDEKQEDEVRQNALILSAFYEQDKIIPFLISLEGNDRLRRIVQLIRHSFEQYGKILIY